MKINIHNSFLSFLVLAFFSINTNAQNLYFPPVNSDIWETLDKEQLGWCEKKVDSLYDYLGQEGTKSFILLKDGKIVLEKYFGDHDATKPWYWASAGKTLTAFMVGLAQQQGHLNIHYKTSNYLGEGWTSCTREQEDKITIWHQLTMTTGLDDGVANSACTDPTCLVYKSDPGERWSYHNAPYTLLDDVIVGATGQNLNRFILQNLRNSTGITGTFIKVEDNNVFWSNSRSMARFGLLMLNKGKWGSTEILSDSAYVNAMISSSQSLNPSYGYLWWLNGQSKLMVPGSQIVFNRDLAPNAPEDMYCALGKNGQLLCVIPSQNMVWIRMGESPDSVPVPFLMVDKVSEYINDLACSSSSLNLSGSDVIIYPNPVSEYLNIEIGTPKRLKYSIINNFGQIIQNGELNSKSSQISIRTLPQGFYSVILQDGESSVSKNFVVKR